MKLTRFEQRQARALFDAILPSGGTGLAYGATDVDALGHVVQLLQYVPLRTALGIRLMIVALAFAPLWYTGRLKTFTALPRDAGTALLDRLLSSPNYFLRQFVFLVRELTCMAYGGDARVRAAIEQATPDATGEAV